MILVNLHILPIGCDDIEKGFIQIKDGKIKTFGPMPVPDSFDDFDTLDLNGCYLTPGLIDAHSHLGMFGDSLGFEGEDGNEMTDPLTPQIRAIDSINSFDRGFSEALDYGVTTVLTGPGSANPISGQSALIKTYGRCVDDMIIKAPMAMKMALGENPKGVYSAKNQAPQTRMGIASLIREELQRSLRYMEDGQKAREDEDLDAPEFDAKCEALIPVLKGSLPVHVHAHRADDIFTAIRLFKEFNLKGVLVHATESHLIADYISREGLSVLYGPILGTRSKPELTHLSRSTPGILESFSVPFAICTDHPEMPQDTLMLSAAIAFKNGASAIASLESVTLTPAKICGMEGRLGCIKVGADADLVVYPSHPLSGLDKPVAVFIDGEQVR